MDPTKQYTLAVSLPRAGYYLILSRYNKESKCVWSEEDRQAFLAVQEKLLHSWTNAETAKVSYYVPDLSPEQAVSRVLPYRLTTYNTSRQSQIVNEGFNHFVVEGPAAEDGKSGLLLALISKEPGKLVPTRELLDKLPTHMEDISKLEVRSDREFLRLAATCAHPFEGKFKIVAVPAGLNVRLTANIRGEYITEVPRVWS